jgi:hypothetical protein
LQRKKLVSCRRDRGGTKIAIKIQSHAFTAATSLFARINLFFLSLQNKSFGALENREKEQQHFYHPMALFLRRLTFGVARFLLIQHTEIDKYITNIQQEAIKYKQMA